MVVPSRMWKNPDSTKRRRPDASAGPPDQARIPCSRTRAAAGCGKEAQRQRGSQPSRSSRGRIESRNGPSRSDSRQDVEQILFPVQLSLFGSPARDVRERLLVDAKDLSDSSDTRHRRGAASRGGCRFRRADIVGNPQRAAFRSAASASARSSRPAPRLDSPLRHGFSGTRTRRCSCSPSGLTKRMHRHVVGMS